MDNMQTPTNNIIPAACGSCDFVTQVPNRLIAGPGSGNTVIIGSLKIGNCPKCQNFIYLVKGDYCYKNETLKFLTGPVKSLEAITRLEDMNNEEQARLHYKCFCVVSDRVASIIDGFIVKRANITVEDGRDKFLGMTFLERICSNLAGISDLTARMEKFNGYYIPVSQMLRAVVYDAIIVRWLFEKDFTERLSKLNGDFIKRRKEFINENEEQKVYAAWRNIAPANFEVIKKIRW